MMAWSMLAVVWLIGAVLIYFEAHDYEAEDGPRSPGDNLAIGGFALLWPLLLVLQAAVDLQGFLFAQLNRLRRWRRA